MNFFQKTIKNEFILEGRGVHNGKKIQLIIRPGKVDTGLIFVRRDEKNQKSLIIPHVKNVKDVSFCTEIANEKYSIKTIEHLMAAIAGLEIDNLEIETTENEIPILDGSAFQFVENFEKIGIIEEKAPKKYIRVLKSVRVDFSYGYAKFEPFDGRRYDISINFSSKHIQNQSIKLDLTPELFKKEIVKARTFGFKKDEQFLKERGLAQGTSLENSIIIDENDLILNKEGLFFKDEFVRHKLLDAVGDLSLLGYPFLGHFSSYCSGHRYNIEICRALLAEKNAYEIIELSDL